MANDDVMRRMKAALTALPADAELDAETIARLGQGLARRVMQVTQQLAKMHGDGPLKADAESFVACVLAVMVGHVKEHGVEWLTDGAGDVHA